MFNFFRKKSKKNQETTLVPSIIEESPKNTSVISKTEETLKKVSDSMQAMSADEIWDKVDEVRNRGKHHIVFEKSTISKSVASELREAGLRIIISTSKFEVFC